VDLADENLAMAQHLVWFVLRLLGSAEYQLLGDTRYCRHKPADTEY